MTFESHGLSAPEVQSLFHQYSPLNAVAYTEWTHTLMQPGGQTRRLRIQNRHENSQDRLQDRGTDSTKNAPTKIRSL